MPSYISTKEILKAFTGVNCSPVYDLDRGWFLSFSGEANEPGWQDLRDRWEAHIKDREPHRVEITLDGPGICGMFALIALIVDFGCWFRKEQERAATPGATSE